MQIQRTILTLIALVAIGGGVARADMSCSQNTFSSTILRSEGVTELLPPIGFNCTGVPTGGSAIVNLTVNVSAPITSKTDGSLNKEAVLTWSGSASGSAVGVLVGISTLSFPNVVFTPADASGFTFTLSGVRVNASTLAQSAGIANGVSVQFLATPVGVGSPLFGAAGLLVNVSNVAFALPSLSVVERVPGANGPVAGRVTLSQCDTRTWTPTPDPGPAAFYVTFQETFSSGFRTRDQEQTNPAAATNGTRLKLTFDNIPNNVQLYLKNIVSQAGALTTAALVSGANSDGSGGTPVTTDGYTQVTSASAFYEFTEASGPLTETLDVPVWVEYTSNKQPVLTSLTSPFSVAGSYAPVSSAPGAAIGPIPRFTMVPQVTTGAFSITPCQTALLYPYIQTSGGWNTGVAVSNTGSDPFGTLGQANSCTFYFYGGTPSGTNPIPTPATIPAFTTPAIPPGSTWTSVASNMGAVSFQGYAIAQCDFRYAHGYAFVAGAISSSYVAQSYLALVLDGGELPKPRNDNPGEHLSN